MKLPPLVPLLGLGRALAGRALSVPLSNPCKGELPEHLARHELVQAAWEGVDAAQAWDMHVHLVGEGDGGSGCWVNPDMDSPLHPGQFMQKRFLLNAGCAHQAGEGGVDNAYAERLRRLAAGMAPGFKVLLLAFDFCRDERGVEDCGGTTFHTPNGYAAKLAQRHPEAFAWAASIHPYRSDALSELEWAVERGAVAMKWLPSAQNINPADARCDAFYAALAQHDLPLVVHCGEEKTARAAGLQHLGNPLNLRRALDHGVRVVVAHCATLGLDADLDRDGRSVASFDLFARLMDDPGYQGRLFGDISAITLINRVGRVRDILAREAWHGRLLNGSDYPLPGIMAFYSPEHLARLGLLPPKAVPVLNAIQQHNPLLFDFVLKRHLNDGGRRFPSAVFETRRFFEKTP